MSTKNQRLNATITIGSVLEASVKRNVGFLKSGLSQVSSSIKEVERRQKELDRQRDVLRRQGKSVAHLDREYEELEATLNDLRRAQERWNRAAAASRRVGTTFRDMASDIGRNARRIGLAATAAGASMFAVASSTASLGDEVAKTADKLGFGIEGFQELRYAAERSGVATSTFDSSMVALTKRVGEAAQGFGAGKRALEQLGLSAEELVSLAPEQQLAMIADRMQGIEDPAERAAIAAGLFSRAGIGMVNMLRDGSQGLEQLRSDARRTGYVLSEETARDAEVFQDTLLDTQLALGGLKNTIGAALMPVVTQAMRRIGDTLIQNRESVKRWADGFADGVERALPLIGEVVMGIAKIGGIVWDVVEGTAEMVGGWENFGMVVGAVLASRTIVRVGKFGAAVFSLGKALFSLTRVTPLVVSGIRAIGTALMLNPIGLAVAGIAGGAYLIWRNWERVAPWFEGLWGDVRTYFRGFGDFVSGVFTGDLGRAASGVETMWKGTSSALGRILGGIGSVFRWSYDNLIKPVTDAMGITDPIEAAWGAARSVIEPILRDIGGYFSGMGDLIGGVITGDVQRAADGIEQMWQSTSSAIGQILEGIGGVFSNTWSAQIKPVIDALMATGGVTAAWEALKAGLDPVLTWIGDKFRAIMAFITPVIDGLKWVQEKGAAAVQGLGNVLGIGGEPAPTSQGLISRGESRRRPQANALGGPFRPGWHLTGELGPELKFENRSGYVANNRAMRQLAGYADRVGSLMDKPAMARAASTLATRAQRVAGARDRGTRAEVAPQAGVAARVEALFSGGGSAPQRAPQAAAGPVTQHITYTINAAGASAEEVIRLVERKSRQAAGNGLFDRAPATGPYGR